MKTAIQFTAILLFGILFISTACNKDKTPDEDKDWNVLEWTVDGERYKAECEGDPLFGCDPVDCQYYHDTKSLNFRGGDLNKHGIKLYIRKGAEMGIYDIFKAYDEIFYGNGNLSSDCGRFYIDTNFNYHVELLEIDTAHKIIEGDFNFTGVSDCQDTVEVSDGYFKLSYRP